MNENAAGFLLVALETLLGAGIIAVMTFIAYYVLNCPLARGKPKQIATLLGLAWFFALSSCALPVALLVGNPLKGPLVAVGIALALFMGIFQVIATMHTPQLEQN